MKKKHRQTYRPDVSAEIADIQQRRQALGLSEADLCELADISPSTWWRMKRDRKAFRRRINALRMALRTAAQRQRNAEGYLP